MICRWMGGWVGKGKYGGDLVGKMEQQLERCLEMGGLYREAQ